MFHNKTFYLIPLYDITGDRLTDDEVIQQSDISTSVSFGYLNLKGYLTLFYRLIRNI